MIINLKESENERMERMLQTLNKRGAENYEKRRQQTIREEIERERIERAEAIKAEQERIRKEREEQERIEKEMRKKEITRRQQEELNKMKRERIEKERKERIKLMKKIIAVVCTLGSITFISYILDPVGFVEFFKIVGSIIVLIITVAVVGFVNSMPHYTKPHRYIVQDEINKNYKVEKGWHTTTYVPKDRR